MSTTAIERAAALAALVPGTPATPGGGAAPALEPTGNVVEAGGDVRRLLVQPAHLAYIEGEGATRVLVYADAVPGDVVLLTAKQAKRLDALKVTVEEPTGDDDEDDDGTEEEDGDNPPAPPAASPADGAPTDEELDAMGAPELVAYVAQHPEQAPRVRELELARRESRQRSSVLEATDPDKLDTTQQ